MLPKLLHYKKTTLSFLLLTIIAGSGFWYFKKPKLTELQKQGEVGDFILNNNFSQKPIIPIKQNENNYQLTDSLLNGPTIQYANLTEEQKKEEENKPKNELNIELPKNYQEPIHIKLDEQRIISITDKSDIDFRDKLITEEIPLIAKIDDLRFKIQEGNWEENLEMDEELINNEELRIKNKEENPESMENETQNIEQKSTQNVAYLKYQSKDKRKSIYYAYQKYNQERTLKHWAIYDKPKKDQTEEQETYQISNAKIKLNNQGQVEVYYFGQQDIQNEQVKAEVDSDLMARAQRTLQKELGEDILNTDNHTLDFIIPQPYYINQKQERKTLTWNINQDTNEISINFNPNNDEYPIALDPTIQFTAPGQESGGDTITLDPTNSEIGRALVSGDLNDDGRIDLVVSSINGGNDVADNNGKVYIFYNDGSIPTTSSTADVIIVGEGDANRFGNVMTVADLNYDGKDDLAVSAHLYPDWNSTGRVYFFYNDGSYPSSAFGADVTIDGEEYGHFGMSMTSGDFNFDSRIDLAVGAYSYSSQTGRAYIFYNDGTIPTTAATADVIITGESTGNYFGSSMTSGDFNFDSRIDLAVGAYSYSSQTGRAYIFYNDGTIPTTAATADVIITGESTGNYFGGSMTSGDFNFDSRIDLAVGAYMYSSQTGRAYIFYNDGTIPTTAATADVIITGESTGNYFGDSMTSGDFNADGKTDLAVGAYRYSSQTGRAYIFYNDGTIPTTAATADVIITGESTGNYFGDSMTSGDFNADGKTDLAVGAYLYSSYTGRAYIFYNDGTIPTTAATADIKITGGAVNYDFGGSMTSGDFNADGKTDLAVGAYRYSSQTGRAYIFYNDGTIPTTAATADVIITGESTGNYFGGSMTSGDFNADGKTDLAVGAYSYSSYTGRAYIFYNDGTIPTTAATADVIITGQSTSNYFGSSMTSGDFNADGKTDLAVGAYRYSSQTGRAYIFYNDGTIPTTAATADVIITGESTGNYFGDSMTSGDFNADGKTDLAVGAYGYSSQTGRAYIFYNDGTIPTTAATADVIITGESTGNYFGDSMTSGDFNADGKTDLAVGAYSYSSQTGRAYIFYNDGTIPTTAATADVIITGESTGNYFGGSMTSGDFNADGKTDLAVGAYSYSSQTGRAYIFYNDGTIPTTAATADVIITGESTGNYFGGSMTSGDFNADGKTDLAVGSPSYMLGKVYIFYSQYGQISYSDKIKGTNYFLNNSFARSMTSGDFNADGKTDLAVGAYGYSSYTGCAYIFYNDGTIPTTAATADVIITGQSTSNYFGGSMTSGDFNADGKTDLAVGAYGYSSQTGRAYIFYNDGTIPTTAATADVIITGQSTSNYFGSSMTSGDFNADGKTDLAVGAYSYSSYTGRAYIFYNDGTIPTTAATADVIITGQSTSNYFGGLMTSGDFNADGKTDLAVGAYGYSFQTGRAYIFYNDGTIPTTAATADVIITGESTSNYFGDSMTSGDFNADGKTDLAVGAYGYSFQTGRAYIFYNDGTIPTTAATADVIITGESTSSAFGFSIIGGDFNYDGKTDLAVGAYLYSSYTGRAYIFYNDGTIPTTAATADVIITGESTGNYFGDSMTSGDFNADGKTDLAVEAYGYSSQTGCAYIFYNDGTYPSAAADADIKITGDTYGPYFGASMTSGDFNNDSLLDLAVGAYGDYVSRGKIYLFYNDGSMPTTPETADASITGENLENFFSYTLSSGDMNNDNQTDIVVGAKGYNTNTGRVYIIYNDGTYPASATDSDIKIDGENSNDNFGYSITTGDIIGDSKTDLIVGANGYSTNTGRAYIFNNDGTLPTTASSADNIITGQNSNDYFGSSLITGDFDYDMDNDLVIGAYGYNTNTGRTYIFNNDTSYPALAVDSDIKIDGEATGNYFSSAFTKGDFNNDNRIDLVIGAYGYNIKTGRVYFFNNDGTISTTAAGADNMITGEDYNNYFGYSIASGDFNADSRVDLAVGAYGFESNKGNSYIFYSDGSIPTLANNADTIIGGNTSGDKLGITIMGGDFNGNRKADLCSSYIGNTWQGGFYIYEVDAEGTKPDYVKNRGGGKVRGTVRMR